MRADDFDCLIVGGGHAGGDASYAAAKVGARTCLITISAESIAKMSCNPAIGGLGKGPILREVDALGGLMGRAINATGIQFRLLNRSKGPAVRTPLGLAFMDFSCPSSLWKCLVLMTSSGWILSFSAEAHEALDGSACRIPHIQRLFSPDRRVT